VSPGDVAAALAGFDPLWETLAPREQHRILRLLVETATYDGTAGTLTVRFRAVGLQTLARERAEHPEEMLA
jgi:site-specific DNA recombinase